jgi:hypothetical protein
VRVTTLLTFQVAMRTCRSCHCVPTPKTVRAEMKAAFVGRIQAVDATPD